MESLLGFGCCLFWGFVCLRLVLLFVFFVFKERDTIFNTPIYTVYSEAFRVDCQLRVAFNFS